MKKRISTKRNDKMEPNRILELKIKKKILFGIQKKVCLVRRKNQQT